VVRGRYEVPIRSGTGIFTSRDGVIATAGPTLEVTEDQVVVYAANRLFQEEMRTALVGNDGDLSRRAQAVEPYWVPHLQHCYERVEHCILFFVPQYQVFPYTQEATGTPADVLPVPDGSTDVGLLQISGGGGTPTAELAPPDQQVPEQALMTGFTQRPDPVLPPTEMAVGVDAATGALSAGEDVAGPLAAGMAGGPVLDPTTGQVDGLVTAGDGGPVLVPAQRLREALEAADAPPAGSQFDAVFRRGIDHLVSGHASTSAVTALQESLTYYDSALAAVHLEEATRAAEAAPGTSTAGADEDGTSGGPGRWVVAGVVVLLLVAGVLLFLRRRRAGPPARGATPAGPPPGPGTTAPRPGTDRAPEPTTERSASVAPAAGAAARRTPADDPSSSRERTRLRQSPALVRDPAPPEQPVVAFCWDCGAPLRDGARFCASCGSAVR
jgi:hypothetical protein